MVQKGFASVASIVGTGLGGHVGAETGMAVTVILAHVW